MALAGRCYSLGTRHPQGARPSPLMVRRPRGSGRGLPVKGERRAAWGGGGGKARCRPGGRGHGPPEWRCLAGPAGRVAPGLCAAPEIRAQGGRGARPRAEPPPPPWCQVGALGRGGGRGLEGEGRRGGAERLAEEVLVVLVGVEPQAQIEVHLPKSGRSPSPPGPSGAPPPRGRRPVGPRGGRVVPCPPRRPGQRGEEPPAPAHPPPPPPG